MPTTVMAVRFRKGEVIDQRYEVLSKLGEGGCGTVYRCRRLKDDGEVAVKVLENSADAARFKREAQVMRKAKGLHVVGLWASGRHERAAEYLVLEYADGKSLTQYLSRKGKLPVEEAAWIGVQAVRGLRGVKALHRDLKPDNLLICKNGCRTVTFEAGAVEGASVIKVADFGLAKDPKKDTVSLTNTGAVMGTPLYMSPEQCRNTKQVNSKTDVYALGVILFELVTGRPPFQASNIYDVMAKHCEEDPPITRVPRKIRSIIERCLRKNAAERPTLAQLERQLAGVAGISGSGVEGEGGGWGKWLFLLLVLALAAGAAWWFFPQWWPWLQQYLPKAVQG